MLDHVDSENGKNRDEDLRKLQELELLIKKSDDDLKDLNSKIEDLEKEIRQKENEIKNISQKKQNFKEPKILTRKQLKELNIKREKAKEEKLNELKNNIDIITKSEFEKAKLIRSEAEKCVGAEQKSLLIKALQIEIDALEREFDVKGSILYDNQEKAQEILAEKVFEELKISKLRKEINKSKTSKKEHSYGSDNKEKIGRMISKKNSLIYNYERISNEIEDISLKMKKIKKLLKLKLSEIENLR